jgi:hypothetical protein
VLKNNSLLLWNYITNAITNVIIAAAMEDKDNHSVIQ